MYVYLALCEYNLLLILDIIFSSSMIFLPISSTGNLRFQIPNAHSIFFLVEINALLYRVCAPGVGSRKGVITCFSHP